MITGAMRRRLTTLLTIAILAAACAPTASPTPNPTQTAQDPLPIYRAIAEDVVAIRGLDAPERADPQVIDGAQLQANITADFDKSNPEADVLLAERTLKALGLLPPDASLRDIYLEMQGSQVIGYYDPAVDELFIINRGCTLGASCELGPTERLTYAHEFTHELQDEHFDLEHLMDVGTDQGDRSLGILGLVEGDAVSVQTTWMTGHLTAAELAEVAAAGTDPAMIEVIARTPAILREISLFPYTAGNAFVNALIAQGGYDAVNAAFDTLPASTEQILHPEKYLAGEAPLDVEIPGALADRLGAGWTLDAQDTLGEFQLRVWLREGGLPGDVARKAVEGWGGDRLALLHGPDGQDVVVLISEWDTEAIAQIFHDLSLAAATDMGLERTSVVTGRRVATALGAGAPANVQSILEDLAGE